MYITPAAGATLAATRYVSLAANAFVSNIFQFLSLRRMNSLEYCMFKRKKYPSRSRTRMFYLFFNFSALGILENWAKSKNVSSSFILILYNFDFQETVTNIVWLFWERLCYHEFALERTETFVFVRTSCPGLCSLTSLISFRRAQLHQISPTISEFQNPFISDNTASTPIEKFAGTDLSCSNVSMALCGEVIRCSNWEDPCVGEA